MTAPYRFNRMEFSGSLGDLGTLLPLVVGMVMVNGMSVTGIFYTIGIFYILAGIYFGVPVPVQPMKAISAYAIATGATAAQVSGSAGLICILLFFIGITGTIDYIGNLIPKSVIRGIQLATGMLLMMQGIKLITGQSSIQLGAGATEPFLILQDIGGLPIGLLLGMAGSLLTMALLQSKKYPAALTLLCCGVGIGLFLAEPGTLKQLQPGIHVPSPLPFGLPGTADLTVALFVLVLPQLPMTIGNAIIANTNLSRDYFGEESKKVTYKTTTLSMAFANGLAFLLGGIPLCHGAGGLAAHFKFGARTGGSNIIIGTIFLLLALFFGPQALSLMHLLPISILGVLLIFAGLQLGLSILDMFNRKEMLVVLLIPCITLSSNLAWGFGIGLIVAHLLKSDKFSI